MVKSLRSIRSEQKISQGELAEAACVPVAQLRRWERLLEPVPSRNLTSLAKALGVRRVDLKSALSANADLPEIGEGYVTAVAEDQLILPRREDHGQGIRVLDLFCGTGGFSHGFESTGHFKVTAGLDLLHDRVTSFHRNHRFATAVAADIRKFSTAELGDLALNPDVIIGGPPCQGFSSIRPFRTLTETDPRNSLPEYFMLTLRELKPKWFVFENVVGMLTHQSSRNFFHELLRSFEGLGYKTDWRVINAASFGLPQNRERVIVVGNALGRTFEWPQPTHQVAYRSMAGNFAGQLVPTASRAAKLVPAMTVMDAIGDLPVVQSGEKAVAYGKSKKRNDYQRRMRNGASQLTLHESTAHSEKMLAIIRAAGRNRAALPEGMTRSGFSSCYSRLAADEPSTTITVNFVHPSSNRCIHPYQDRALTPREGARIQSFPDTFEFAGTRAQIVKQIGNAVPPLLGEVLAGAIAAQY
ncbi:DNA (cytosine-5-)-methyltransferase [Dyella mobilis]|uniref:Cytosine-specific methyltransferase n=1 Tax=Dyella mobilis TaxID=1849582 RepID=A0ABS2KG99_9GAMM|nr:DNA (cytosine-5-)-methyltransferase [Dyella mobilis]MBM7130202.1 DNA (cytosine-5-)-methyltransferase [Dyella mobilis]GLQ96827.1 cytosine-specific methyltransferase [Dyella mobilis]